MNQKHFDIRTVPNYGFLVFPLSMSRLNTALSPEKLYEFLEYFETKLTHKTLDVIMLYTNDLYSNSEESGFLLRKKTLNQMLNHKAGLESLILKHKRFFPGAFRFLPWDYALLNGPDFNSERAKLLAHMDTDPIFQAVLQQDLDAAERELTEANLHFLIEELVVSHLIMEKEVLFPYQLSMPDGWRLLCYPGNPPAGLVYLWRKNLLGNRTDIQKQHQIFARSFYNMEAKVLVSF
jgi:hypothetical protein